jgi:hypothetical protein
MVKHISVFFLKEENKEDARLKLLDRLAAVGRQLSEAKAYQIGPDCMQRPPKGFSGLPEFGDVLQIIDFPDTAAAERYVRSEVHNSLVTDMDSLIEKVVAMDIVC